MLELLLSIIGILIGCWWYSVIILPLFYGIPKAIYYTFKGLLERSAIIFYFKTFILWTVIFLTVILILTKFFPSVSNILLASHGFAMGQLIGIALMMLRVLTKNGRKDLNIDFWDTMLRRQNIIISHPRCNEVLTNFLIQKFGEQDEEKLIKLLNEDLKNQQR